MTKCIGTSIWIPYLLPETLLPQARNVIIPLLTLLTSDMHLVAPAFAWSEVGSVLPKKVRLGAITAPQAEGFYDDFCQIPIDYLDSDDIRTKTYVIAE